MIAVLGAVAWTTIAFVRGETVNAVWFVAAIRTYVIGYRFYAHLIETKIVRARDDHATPAEVFDDDTDYVPTDRRVLFGHHFAAITGAGPLVGPVLATQMGYLPCSIWIVVGALLAAEAAGKAEPDAADRLRRHAHRIIRGGDGSDQRRDPGPASVLHPQTVDQLADVITNTFIQGTLCVIFAAVAVIALLAAITVSFKVIRGGGIPLTEDRRRAEGATTVGCSGPDAP